MKRVFVALAIMTFFSSCHRTTRDMWEDTKTAGRYMNRGVTSFFGRHDGSRSRPMLPGVNRNNQQQQVAYQTQPNDFIPLADDERYTAEMQYYPQATESPGDPGSSIPGIDSFNDPQGRLAELFRQVHFDTDTYTIRGEENLAVLQSISNYLQKNRDVYVFVEGHADERGSASYNLALGAKRANAVRDHLIEHGVNHDQLFTISYGKERPVAFGHGEDTWRQNRRSAFKLYER